MYTLSAYDPFRFVGYGAIVNIKIIIQSVSNMAAYGIIILIGCLFWQGLFADDFIRFPVVNDIIIGQGDKQLSLFSPRQAHLI